MLKNKLTEEKVKLLVAEAVEIEREFVCDALPCALVGMNGDLMSKYIEFVADRLLIALGYGKLYNTVNPFDWMELISLQGKTNFFENRVGEYQNASVMNDLNQDGGDTHVFFGEPDFSIESFDKALARKPDSEAKDDRQTALHLVKKRKQLQLTGLSSTAEGRFLVSDES